MDAVNGHDPRPVARKKVARRVEAVAAKRALVLVANRKREAEARDGDAALVAAEIDLHRPTVGARHRLHKPVPEEGEKRIDVHSLEDSSRGDRRGVPLHSSPHATRSGH